MLIKNLSQCLVILGLKLDKNLEIWIDTDYPGLGKNGVGGPWA